MTTQALAEEWAKQAAAAAGLIDPRDYFNAMVRQEDDGVLVPGLLARGQVTNVAAAPKAGKSTLLLWALIGFGASMPRGWPGFGTPLRPLRSLVASENPLTFDSAQCQFFDPPGLHPYTGNVVFLDRGKCPPDDGKTLCDKLTWLEGVVASARDRGEFFDVVVLDTRDDFIPDLEDSNSAAEVQTVYTSLRNFAVLLDVALVLVMHTNKKSDGKLDFNGILGSTKTRGAADFNVVMARHDQDSDTDRRILVRREGRNPWAFARMLGGPLPNTVPKYARDREHAEPATLCFDPVREDVEIGGRTWVHLTFERVPVPGRSGAVKGSTLDADARDALDDEIVVEGYRRHEAADGVPGISPRKLQESGVLDDVVEGRLDLPPKFSVSHERAKAAAVRVVVAGLMTAESKKRGGRARWLLTDAGRVRPEGVKIQSDADVFDD